MDKVIILSNEKQFNVAAKLMLKDTGTRVLCDNRSFGPFLKEKGAAFTAVGDTDIRHLWKDIDAWACEKALLSDKELERFCAEGLDIGNILYPWFSYYLDSFLRNYLLAEFILKKYDPKEVIVFENADRPEIPVSNANYFLNVSLRYLAERSGRKVTAMDAKEAVAGKGRRSYKEKARKAFSGAYVRLNRVFNKKPAVIVRGSIDHMSSVMNELRHKGYNIFIYDFEFRIKDFIFSLKSGAGYIVGRSSGDKKKEAHLFSAYINALTIMLEYLRSTGWFSYKSDNIGDIICPGVLKASRTYIKTLASDAAFYSGMIERGNIKGIVLNDDQSPYGSFFAAFFKSRNIPVFCISHGFPLMSTPIDINKRGFSLSSKTFVQSEYERDLYIHWGWSAEGLHVTGKPLYDGLASMKKNGINKREETMKILFCGTTLVPIHPTVNMCAGGYCELDGDHTRECMISLIKAVMLYKDIELVIKPHYDHDRHLWAEAVNEFGGSARIKLVPATTDFLSVASECHAMFTPCWSTAIIECLMLKIPVIRMDYTGANTESGLIPSDVCIVNKDSAHLKNLISELYASFKKNDMSKHMVCSEKDFDYTVGCIDGNSTSRVIESIMQGNI